MIETDRRVIYHEIRTSLGISMSQPQSILHKYWGMKKLCSRWIPHNFTEVQKTDRVTWWNAMLTRFKEGASNLVQDIVTGYETWIYVYDLKTTIDRMGLSRRAEINQSGVRAKYF
ncbi:hypothetical protein EVAR_47780_1 [Eumeta japonica]|uniref:Mariner Mos1 transposase n=1 Tax=Eumeta variegata TaxID=151549 RepID=A0A4C1XY22_EUMVA|nr:hypothetical protein EVAR_47780_1 [Eumeta japonica]